jgi:uracil-DNA glycosylase family 4
MSDQRMHPIEALGLALEKYFKGVEPDSFEILYSRLTQAGRSLPPMRGRGFFPAADGLWKEGGERRLAAMFPRKPIMFLGQDLNAQKHFGAYIKDIAGGYQEEGGATWLNLTELIDDSGIPRSECFFTNLLPGVRIGDKNANPSKALNDLVFMRRCLDFLDAQIRIIEPCALVVMGMEPIKVILRNWRPELSEWKYWDTGAIDNSGLARFNVQRPYGSVEMAFIAHPAYAGRQSVNVGRRAYKTCNGWEAQLAVLRECHSMRGKSSE